MIQQTPAKIFLAEKQLIQENEKARTASVINNTSGWFGNLYICNDETLAAHTSLEVPCDVGYTILIPVVGSIHVKANDEEGLVIPCGEILVLSDSGRRKVVVSNFYKNELINFLHLRIHAHHTGMPRFNSYAFDLNTNKNELIPVFANGNTRVQIGKFEMRKETDFFSNEINGVFCFVIQGSFEIAGRLLHSKDALALWNINLVEIESLGKESILLLLEIPV